VDSDGYFGAEIAEHYDEDQGDAFQPATIAATVDRLAALAGDGPVLEFAIGTGRIALPLAGRGIEVHGLDLSRAMLAQLHRKPGADAIRTTVGSYAQTRVPGTFSLVYLVFNTIENVLTQDEQVDCFRNAAAHLAPGGRFLIEVNVPELRKLPPGQTAVPFTINDRQWAFDTYDCATQALSSNYVTMANGAATYLSVPFRYVWPAELDLMARLAGMRLEHRWAGWQEEPFTHESGKHVSVWRLSEQD
jgi:SAM-dependent methyltransferase